MTPIRTTNTPKREMLSLYKSAGRTCEPSAVGGAVATLFAAPTAAPTAQLTPRQIAEAVLVQLACRYRRHLCPRRLSGNQGHITGERRCARGVSRQLIHPTDNRRMGGKLDQNIPQNQTSNLPRKPTLGAIAPVIALYNPI